MSNCISCGNTLPLPFLDLGETPLANAYVKPERTHLPEPRHPLRVSYCERCHLVQLHDRVPPEEMFSEYLYFSSFSDIQLAHAREMTATLAARFHLGTESKVLEIASNDGYLLQYFQQKKIQVLGVEPAANIARHAMERGIPTVNCFFGPAAVDRLKPFVPVQLIIGNNVLAHIPEINAFLRTVRDCLAPGGHACFEFPYLLELIAHREFDTIYHEHVSYFSVTAIKGLVERAGLTLVDVAPQAVHGGSLRIFLAREEDREEPRPVVAEVLSREDREGLTGKDRYFAFAREVEDVRRGLVDLLESLRAGGKTIAAYGAPAKGNTLLNYCGIDRDLVGFTVERSPHKQNLLLPGSHIPIYTPAELLTRMPNFVLILPWNLAAEIVEQQTEYLKRGGQFIIPIPEPRVLARETGVERGAVQPAAASG